MGKTIMLLTAVLVVTIACIDPATAEADAFDDGIALARAAVLLAAQQHVQLAAFESDVTNRAIVKVTIACIDPIREPALAALLLSKPNVLKPAVRADICSAAVFWLIKQK